MNTPHRTVPRARGFTLIELMVVGAIGALLVLLAAPSFQEMILKQRLRGVNAQLVTDMQYARSEAVSRGETLRVVLRANLDQTCYTLYTAPGNGVRCDCLEGAGNACTAAGSVELKTVNLPKSAKVLLNWEAGKEAFGYEAVRGGLVSIPTDFASAPIVQVNMDTSINSADDPRRLRTTLVQSGRPSVCTFHPEVMQTTACPPELPP